MTYQEWFNRWGHMLPPHAHAEFSQIARPDMHMNVDDNGMSEAAAASRIIHTGAREFGAALWRNNNGAFQDDRGVWVRYGLGNLSKRLNEKWKSSDYIGPTPVLIRPDHVGKRLGIFTAIETKAPGWKLTLGDKRGNAQAHFMNTVANLGGIAGFAQSEDCIRRILQNV